MTEEEKKAIARIERLYRHSQNINHTSVVLTEDTRCLGIVLNLIEKQQKEIEELRKLAEFQKEYRNKLEQDLFENCSNFVVPKDKIREKIEELEKAGTTETRNNKNEVVEKHYFLQDEIDVLKELLEE